MKNTTRVQCSEPGCREFTVFAYETVKDRRCPRAIQRRATWKCTRHFQANRVMSPTDTHKEITYTATRINGSLYWTSDDAVLKTGFNYSPAHKAFAKDFPEGTTLRITAKITLPDFTL